MAQKHFSNKQLHTYCSHTTHTHYSHYRRMCDSVTCTHWDTQWRCRVCSLCWDWVSVLHILGTCSPHNWASVLHISLTCLQSSSRCMLGVCPPYISNLSPVLFLIHFMSPSVSYLSRGLQWKNFLSLLTTGFLSAYPTQSQHIFLTSDWLKLEPVISYSY